MTLNFMSFQTSFFRQHNCDTNDTQLKYKSRAAQLYRDKLHNEAAKAMRVHGTKLFIDAPQSTSQDVDENEELNPADADDFFTKHETEAAVSAAAAAEASATSVQPLPKGVKLAVRIMLIFVFL